LLVALRLAHPYKTIEQIHGQDVATQASTLA
jgi:hypothetical protein